MKNDGSGNPVNTTRIFELDNEFIGIGTVTPTARLHIQVPGSSPQPDCFAISRPIGYPTPVLTSYFTVTGNGHVGIGVAAPEAPLEVRTRNWYTSTTGLGEYVQVYKDPDDNIIGAFLNVDDDGSNPGGAMAILAGSADGRVSFSVINTFNNTFPFAVLDDGTVAAGAAIGSFVPEAQLNFIEQNGYDYLLKMQSTGQIDDYLTVHNDGYVGIGYANGGTATLQVITPPASTGNASVIITGDAPNDRYLFIGNGTSPASAAAYLSVKNTGVGIGVDALGEAQLVIKGSSGTKLDLIETAGSVDYNAQIRFIGSDAATIRHLITEDASGNLLIDAGFSTAQNKVKIDGELETNNNVKVNGTFTVVGSSANQFKVGTDGKVRAREVQVDLATIPDYVFDKDYKLPTIEQLQKFITTNRHLPNVPGECEYESQGSINLGELNLKLLEKVEELSLYIIQLNERLKQIENEKQ